MINSNGVYIAEKPRRLTGIIALLAMVTLLFVSVADAVPGNGKGGNKGGGGGDTGGGGGFQTELHYLWSVQLDAPYSLVRPAIGPDGTIYAVDVYDNLVAVAPDGTVLWRVAEAGSKGVDVGSDGTIYTGNEDWIKAFNPGGTLKWTFMQSPRAFVFIDVAVGPDGYIYAVASSGMGVFSLEDTLSGPEIRWTNPEAYSRTFVGYTEIAFGPTADGRDQQLYFYANGHTRAVRLSDGASIFTTGGNNTRPQVSAVDGTWHKGDAAFNPDNSLAWSFDFPLAAGFSEPSLAWDGTHYAVVSANQLYAINSNGVQQFQAALNENVGIPDVDPTKSLVIMDTYNTRTSPLALKAVSATNGSELWRMEFPLDPAGDQFISSGVAYSDTGDTAYVMTSVNTANRTYLNAVATDPSLPSASTIVRSSDISLGVRSKRNTVSFTGTVSVTDQNKGAVSGATVHATWTLPDGSMVSQVATSSGSGEAKFSVTGAGGIYRIEVTEITMDGYTFDDQHSLLSAARAWF
jgi:hypothetical protein